MSTNILVKDILLTDETSTFPLQIDRLEENIQHQIEDSIHNYEVKSNLDSLLINTTDSQDNLNALAINNMDAIATGNDHDTIIGIANAFASSEAKAASEVQLIADDDDISTADANSEAIADAEAIAIGIDNTETITTGRGRDTIIGIANASASGSSMADSRAELVLGKVSSGDAISNSVATVNVVATAIGISNVCEISTGRGHDTIIGVANASASGSSMANSQAASVFGNDSSATANSESIVVVETLAIGIDNIYKITTGKGHDVIIGVASNSAISQAEATALANNTAALATELATEYDSDAFNQLETAISKGTSTAIANSKTTTLGIFNSGKILMDRGNDVIIGLANNTSSSSSQAISEAESIANDVAIATADGESLAISEGAAVGIVNLGTIHTGMGNDTIIGIAVNDATAAADADANAVGLADDPDTQTNTNAIADTSEAIAIGIDNASGLMITAGGDDQVIGIGAIGITGGNIRAGNGNDRIMGYGSFVGVEDIKIQLGKGDDFFKAAIVDLDPLTGEISLQDDQSGSLKNTAIFGGLGNDTFEIGGFEATVSIDGGRDHDVIKLWGNLDDYEITLGSSGNQAVTIEDSDSMLTVKNVEAFYFGNSDRVYSFDDFA
ncbi:MAG: hypothetical protein WBM44_21095 [Waterburya sp.]